MTTKATLERLLKVAESDRDAGRGTIAQQRADIEALTRKLAETEHNLDTEITIRENLNAQIEQLRNPPIEFNVNEYEGEQLTRVEATIATVAVATILERIALAGKVTTYDDVEHYAACMQRAGVLRRQAGIPVKREFDPIDPRKDAIRAAAAELVVELTGK